MTNRERAKVWLLDTYPSAWEAEHVDALTSLLNEVVQAERARIVTRLRAGSAAAYIQPELRRSWDIAAEKIEKGTF